MFLNLSSLDGTSDIASMPPVSAPRPFQIHIQYFYKFLNRDPSQEMGTKSLRSAGCNYDRTI